MTVEERLTGGAEENEQLLHNPKSGVDVAFMHGGIVRPQDRGNLTMLMALYYEPLWIFLPRSGNADATGMSSAASRSPSARREAAPEPSSSRCLPPTASPAPTPG